MIDALRHGAEGCCGTTVSRAACPVRIALAEGCCHAVDGRCIIRGSVSYSTEVLNVTVALITGWREW